MKIASHSKALTNAEPLRVPIVETYPEELQPFTQQKSDQTFQPSKNMQFHHEKGKWPQMRIGKIKTDTPETKPRVIPEMEETPKLYTRLKRISTNK